jgi:hypothetical protein
MKKTSFLLASCLVLGSTYSVAGSVKTSSSDITLSGGASAGYFYGTTQGSNNNDNFVVSDFMLEFASPEAKTGGVSFFAGFGNLAQVTYLNANGDGADAASTLRYASMTYVPVKNLSVEAGLLATNVGAELASSYSNGNIILGALWNAQPLFYPGARVNYALGDVSLYAETSSPKSFAVGALGSAGGVDYAVSYFDPDAGNNLIDVVLTSEVAGMSVGLNFDYQMADEKAAGASDDSGFGLGLYVSPKVGPIDLPVRVEYISDGDSGIYGFDSGYTLAVTPTLNISDNAFVRVELSMAKADNKIFADSDGVAKDSTVGGAFQMGYRF